MQSLPLVSCSTHHNNDRKLRLRQTLPVAHEGRRLCFLHGRGAVLQHGSDQAFLDGSRMGIHAAGAGPLELVLEPGSSLVCLDLVEGPAQGDLQGQREIQGQGKAPGLSTLPLLGGMAETVRCLAADGPFPGPAGDLFRQAKILELAAFSLHCLGCPLKSGQGRLGRDTALVQEARRMVETDLARVPGLADLAARLGTNESRLNACFRAVLGCTPHEYIREQRLVAARELVAGTDLPMGEIAARVGFASQAHFSVAFQKETGCRPRDYRKTQGMPA